MTILTCKQTCECISLQIFSKYPIQKSWDRTNPPDLPTLKAYPTPGVGGRFKIFSLKWRERMNLKVPGAILPFGCAILSTRAITVRGGWYNPPLGELGLTQLHCKCILSASFPKYWISFFPVSLNFSLLCFVLFLFICLFLFFLIFFPFPSLENITSRTIFFLLKTSQLLKMNK